MKTQSRLSRPGPLCQGLFALIFTLALACTFVWAKKPPKPPPEPPPEPESGYRMIDLGTLGGARSIAYKINEAGWIVGEAEVSTGQFRAFVVVPEHTDGLPDVWSRDDDDDGLNDLMIDLGFLGFGPDGESSTAHSINHDGQVVGYSTVNESAGGSVHAVLWQSMHGNPLSDPWEMIDLGVMMPGTYSHAYAINNQGQVVGESGGVGFLINPVDVDGDGEPEWFLDDGSGGNALMIPLGMSSLGYGVTPLAINDAGKIAGIAQTGSDRSQAFLLRPTDVDGDSIPDLWFEGENGLNELISVLGPLPGGDWCEARAINSFGQVLGSSRDDDSNRTAHWHAVLWEVDPVGIVLQTDWGRVQDEEHTLARDLNDLGQAVGYCHTVRGKFPLRATVTDTAWLRRDGSIILLPDLIVNWGPFDGQSDAHGLNERAEIVGSARISSVPQAYVAVPVR